MKALIAAEPSSSLRVGQIVINNEYSNKVARKLAAESGPWFDTFPDKDYPDNDSVILGVIRASIDLPADTSYGQLLYRLGELINPTCYVVSTISYDWSDGTEYSHELSCGHTCNTVYPDPPTFCDKCGARVVRDGE